MNKKLKVFYEMVDKMETAMFTTRRSDGHLVSRPMATQNRADGADLWFVTYKGADKIREIAKDPHVNLSYYKDRTREWISVSGIAEVSEDRQKIRELYMPDWKAWFGNEGGKSDGGPDDPRMVLVGVTIHSVYYLQINKPQPVVLFELVKGMITGKRPNLGKIREIGAAEARASRKPASRSSGEGSKKSRISSASGRKSSGVKSTGRSRKKR